jgi:hypothetical protein
MATEQLSRHCPLVQRAAGVAVWVSLRLCHAARSGRGARADWAPASLRPLRYMKRKSDRRHSICRAAFVFGGMVRVHMTWRALGLAAGRRVRSGRSGRSVRCRLHGDTRRWRGAFAPSRSILTVLLCLSAAVAVRRAMQGQPLGQCCTRPSCQSKQRRRARRVVMWAGACGRRLLWPVCQRAAVRDQGAM